MVRSNDVCVLGREGLGRVWVKHNTNYSSDGPVITHDLGPAQVARCITKVLYPEEYSNWEKNLVTSYRADIFAFIADYKDEGNGPATTKVYEQDAFIPATEFIPETLIVRNSILVLTATDGFLASPDFSYGEPRALVVGGGAHPANKDYLGIGCPRVFFGDPTKEGWGGGPSKNYYYLTVENFNTLHLYLEGKELAMVVLPPFKTGGNDAALSDCGAAALGAFLGKHYEIDKSFEETLLASLPYVAACLAKCLSYELALYDLLPLPESV